MKYVHDKHHQSVIITIMYSEIYSETAIRLKKKKEKKDVSQ